MCGLRNKESKSFQVQTQRGGLKKRKESINTQAKQEHKDDEDEKSYFITSKEKYDLATL